MILIFFCMILMDSLIFVGFTSFWLVLLDFDEFLHDCVVFYIMLIVFHMILNVHIYMVGHVRIYMILNMRPNLLDVHLFSRFHNVSECPSTLIFLRGVFIVFKGRCI